MTHKTVAAVGQLKDFFMEDLPDIKKTMVKQSLKPHLLKLVPDEITAFQKEFESISQFEIYLQMSKKDFSQLSKMTSVADKKNSDSVEDMWQKDQDRLDRSYSLKVSHVAQKKLDRILKHWQNQVQEIFQSILPEEDHNENSDGEVQQLPSSVKITKNAFRGYDSVKVNSLQETEVNVEE